MRHDRVERVVPRNGDEGLANSRPDTSPQPVRAGAGLLSRHVRRKTVSHCALRCMKLNSDDPPPEPANVRGRMAEQFAQHVFVVFRMHAAPRLMRLPICAGVWLSLKGACATGHRPILVPSTSVSHRAPAVRSWSQRSSVWQTPRNACGPSRSMHHRRRVRVHAPTRLSRSSWLPTLASRHMKRESARHASAPATRTSAFHWSSSKQEIAIQRSTPLQR